MMNSLYLRGIAEALEDPIVTNRNDTVTGYLRRIAEALEDPIVTSKNDNVNGYSERIGDALAVTAGGDVSYEPTLAGYWARIATLSENILGATIATNDNTAGYMLRAFAANGGPAGGSILSIVAARGGFFLDPSGSSPLAVNADGTGGAPAAGDLVGRVYDASGLGNHAVAVSAATRPLLQADGSLLADGVNDRLQITKPAVASDLSLFMVMATTDTLFRVFHGALSTEYIGNCVATTSAVLYDGVGAPTLRVDGAEVPGGTTRNEYRDMLNDGVTHIAEASGADCSAWDYIDIMDCTALKPLAGTVFAVVGVQGATAAEESVIRNELATAYSVTLP
jgi:hypothetical protein